ncbi:MAG: nucleotidyltransferase family protein [Vicinamibacterales bacterium]
MKAIMLAGGKGTRLRPLTIHTPKPIVPIFERPFLHYQLDLLKQVPEIDEVILSLNYQPRRIEEIFGDGSDAGLNIRYVVEPTPLGTAGAVRYAGESLHESVVVFNGDVLTNVDLAAVLALHRERKAKATIVLTPVENPTAYGLVETDAAGNIRGSSRSRSRTRSPATRSTRGSTSSSPRRSIASRRAHRGRSSAASSRR